mmetsp:Transcript_135928/g.253985  ORF Transcript_135928/g.253985 Transcript_135928/m.253985 type:complete len:433 (+) Transcript_135928:75-1373(+)
MGVPVSKTEQGQGQRIVSARQNPLASGEYTVPVMTAEEVSKIVVPFAAVRQSLRSTLEEHGLAIVTDVISAEEVSAMERFFMNDVLNVIDEEKVSSAPQIVQDAYSEFKSKGLQALPLRTASEITQAAGFALDRCLPHGTFAWAARKHPNVHKTFQAIFPNAEGFVTSVDVPFFTPGGQKRATKAKFTAHVDQNKHDIRPGLADCEVYQGVLYVWSSEDDHASTTTAWPGSHTTVWEEMMQDASFKMSGGAGFHYSEVSQMQDKGRAQKLAAGWATHARRLPVPSGALLLWNSRTMHTGWKGGPRLAQAVCLEPVERRPPQERLSKLRLVALGLPSVHWASHAMQHDMSLGAPGVFSRDSVEAKGHDGSSHDRVQLPLRPAIRPEGLVNGKVPEELKDLIDVDYRCVGMWDAPQSVAPLLEGSVAENVKLYV